MARRISVQQANGEALTVDAGPGMTTGEFKEHLKRLRGGNEFMGRLTMGKVFVDHEEFASQWQTSE